MSEIEIVVNPISATKKIFQKYLEKIDLRYTMNESTKYLFQSVILSISKVTNMLQSILI